MSGSSAFAVVLSVLLHSSRRVALLGKGALNFLKYYVDIGMNMVP